MGVQTDEALFTAGIYQAHTAYYTIRLFHHQVPLMLESYVGTLKSLIYVLVFQIFTPGASSTRTPVLLIGVATIWLFFQLLGRISGTPAAIAGTVLLATDSIFLLTTVFDWGPVALQHLLLVSSMLLLYRYYERRRLSVLAWAGFLLGLAMWDKAVFSWSLSALVVASLMTFPRTLWSLAIGERVHKAHKVNEVNQVGSAASTSSFTWFTSCTCFAPSTFLLTFLLGAAPLLIFNIAHRGETFRSNVSGAHERLSAKFPMVLFTLRGEGLFGYLMREDNDGSAPLPPRTALARASDRVSAIFDHPRRNLMLPALAGALLLLPLLWRARARAPRTMLFAAVFCLVAWLQMASNQGTGGSVHHVVLLWPFPQLLIAVAFGEAAQKFRRVGTAALTTMLLLVAGSSLLVTNEYYRMTLRNGGSLFWSDALFPLAGYMKDVKATQILPIDWGIFDSLRLLDAGKLPLRVGVDPLSKPSLDAADREAVRQWLITPGTVFVAHTDANQVFPNVNIHLYEIAAANGLAKESMGVFRDRNGREIFQVFRFNDR